MPSHVPDLVVRLEVERSDTPARPPRVLTADHLANIVRRRRILATAESDDSVAAQAAADIDALLRELVAHAPHLAPLVGAAA